MGAGTPKPIRGRCSVPRVGVSVVDLKAIQGLGQPTIVKLNKAGVRTVEQLALIDTRRKTLQGIATDRVIKLRRMAQQTIFKAAAGRVKTVAKTATKRVQRGAKDLEAALERAAASAVDAARQAEASAAAAFHHAQRAAQDLAKIAAENAVQAKLVAEQQLDSIRQRLRKEKVSRRSRAGRFLRALERAGKVAQVAADKAVSAAAHAGEATAEAAKDTAEKSQSLYARLVSRVRSNGRK